MMGRANQVLAKTAFALVVTILVAALGFSVYNVCGDVRKRNAEEVISLFQQKMVLDLHGDMSGIGDLAAAAQVDHGDMIWFSSAAEQMLAEDSVLYIAYVDKETMRYALPTEPYGDSVGEDISSFSYVYTLAKVTQEFVVEGPVVLETGESAFLFIEPVLSDGVYVGEVIVALSADFVIGELGFSELVSDGYRYELWAVSPQDGSKDIISVSDDDFDFSHAVKISFNMPTQWTLSVVPNEGWVPASWTTGIVAVCVVVIASILGLAASLSSNRRLHAQIKDVKRRDPETRLLTFDGLTKEISDRVRKGVEAESIVLICLAVEGFDRVASLVSRDERQEYLRTVAPSITALAPAGSIAGRVNHSVFVVAVFEPLSRLRMIDLAHELELALLWKVRIGEEKVFCSVRSRTAVFPEDGSDFDALVCEMAECVARGDGA